VIGRLVQRIPADARKSIAGGLVFAAVFAVLFGFLDLMIFTESTEEKCEGHLWNKECTDVAIPLGERIPHLFIAIGLFALAALAVVCALLLTLTQSHLKKYQAILTGVESMPVQQIADITHMRVSRVRNEIQTLIDSDEISDFYIDYQRDQVVSKKYVPKSSHKTVVTCRLCGAHNELIVGITRSCAACGEPLILEAR
tara:strand:- start:3182 stop:3775 length:594 start_codon:yes stop_codon:yes gene_type:complete